jgi:hypothetical protein
MKLKRAHYVLLSAVAGLVLIIFNPIGAFGLAVTAGPIWLWCSVIDPYVSRRHERKIAEMIAEEERAAGPAVPVGESIFAQAPEA